MQDEPYRYVVHVDGKLHSKWRNPTPANCIVAAYNGAFGPGFPSGEEMYPPHVIEGMLARDAYYPADYTPFPLISDLLMQDG